MSQKDLNTNLENIDFLDEKYNQGLLFDFYGELLNENNKSIYADYVLNDLSLSEIASLRGISRQGIHDTIKRTTKKLYEYEGKLHLMKKHNDIKEKAIEICNIIDNIKSINNNEDLDKVKNILKDMLDET